MIVNGEDVVGICVGSMLDERGDDGVEQNWVEPMYQGVNQALVGWLGRPKEWLERCSKM